MEPKTVTVRAGADRPGLPEKPFLESRHFLAKNQSRGFLFRKALGWIVARAEDAELDGPVVQVS
jgi:hypothetical protein